jgi:hypothetical protein
MFLVVGLQIGENLTGECVVIDLESVVDCGGQVG